MSGIFKFCILHIFEHIAQFLNNKIHNRLTKHRILHYVYILSIIKYFASICLWGSSLVVLTIVYMAVRGVFAIKFSNNHLSRDSSLSTFSHMSFIANSPARRGEIYLGTQIEIRSIRSVLAVRKHLVFFYLLGTLHPRTVT